MPYNVLVLYPNNDDTKFDLKYYLETHMPLVSSSWTSDGLKSWQVNEFGPGPDGSKPAFKVGATLNFESPAACKACMTGDKAPKVFGDIPNFTNVQPTVLTGDQVAQQ